MTFADIIADVRSQLNETDASNSHFNDTTDFIKWGNECTEQLCALITTFFKQNLSSLTTGGIAAVNPLVLDSDLIGIDYASIYQDGKYHALETIDFDNFVRINPDWENVQAEAADNVIPSWLVRMTPSTWMLYPFKNYSVGSEPALTIYGRVLPTPVTSTSQEPPISKVMHPVYTYYLLWKAWPRLGNDAKAQQAFIAYDSLRRRNIAATTQTIRGKKQLRMGGY